MNKDEEKAIEWFKYLQQTREEQVRQQAWVGTMTFDAIDTVLNLIKKQKEELEKKDKIINEMASYIEVNEFDDDITSLYCNGVYDDCRHKEDIGHCKQCIIDYFTKRVEE